MFRAIIVEDELLVRVAYQSIVNWEDHGFTLVGAFENGQAALDAFDKLRPDFVLTDTKMPLCDGITLIREIKRRSPETVCIILSAYGDLDYVKDGMRVGADDYLLKLDITREKLGALLAETAQKLHQARKSDVKPVSNDRQMGRDRFLRSWIRGEYSEPNTIRDYLKFYGIQFYQDRLICMSIRIDETPDSPGKPSGMVIGPAVKQTILETLRSAGAWILVDMRSNLYCALGCCDGAAPEKYGAHMRESVVFSLKSVLNLSGAAVQVSVAEGVLEVPEIFSRMFVKHPEKASARETLADEVSVLSEQLIHQLHHLRFAEAAAGMRGLNALFSETRELPVEIMRNHCAYIFMGIHTAMKRDPVFEGYFEEKYPILKEQLSRCFYFREITAWIDHVSVLLEQMGQERAPYASIANRAAAYIRQHYSEDLSLDKIARFIKVSPTYLSRVFAQEQGQGVQEYLTEQRLQKAKELLVHSDAKIYEIAADVGYPDAIYFNKVFKKHTGKTPKEYRMLK